jgi:hypothetical protein
MLVRILRGGANPIGESRRRRLVSCGLNDACNTLVLQRRRGRGLLRKELLGTLMLIQSCTSVVGRLRDGTVRLTAWFDRLIEQDKVLLLWGQVQMLKMQLLRGWCRQA